MPCCRSDFFRSHPLYGSFPLAFCLECIKKVLAVQEFSLGENDDFYPAAQKSQMNGVKVYGANQKGTAWKKHQNELFKNR